MMKAGMTALIALLLSTLGGWPQAEAQGRAQPRPHGTRIEVPADRIEVDDGDTVTIDWPDGDREIVRILGIDTPETQHIAHDLPFDQSFGREALGFARGAFATATKVEMVRASTKDTYGRTLGYLFLNGRNYSAMILGAGLAEESVSRYGDNGLPAEAEACLAASREAGPLPFESPGEFRKRMREVARWMRDRGLLPKKESD